MSIKEICENAGLTSYLGATAENTYVEKDARAFDQQGIDNRVNTSWKRAENIVITDVAGIQKRTLLSQWIKLTDNGKHKQKLYYPVGDGVYELYASDGELIETNELEKIICAHKIAISTGVNCVVKMGQDLRIDRFLAAIRTKPFVLLAGISGTGKSRLVRQLARGCCPMTLPEGGVHPLYDEQKPGNFEMIQVRPNWHDSSELMGYISRITGKDEYQVTDFVKFLCKAWRYEHDGISFFLCLDEMNLAPVEQYFAEYLSVIETRKRRADGKIVTDPLVRFKNETVLRQVVQEAYANSGLTQKEIDNYVEQFKDSDGIPIPSNLVVMGTVNMDETTCSFSRKVLDRAMSFELNDVSDMYDPGNIKNEGDVPFGSIPAMSAMAQMLSGKEAYDADNNIGDLVLGVLHLLNEKEVDAKKEDGSEDAGQKMSLLAKTPFKIAYRTRNEIMIYCLERCVGKGLSALPQALDEALSMKVLSRIEGDNQHVSRKWLVTLSATIDGALSKLNGYNKDVCKVCREKLADMTEQANYGYTSFWTR